MVALAGARDFCLKSQNAFCGSGTRSPCALMWFDHVSCCTEPGGLGFCGTCVSRRRDPCTYFSVDLFFRDQKASMKSMLEQLKAVRAALEHIGLYKDTSHGKAPALGKVRQSSPTVVHTIMDAEPTRPRMAGSVKLGSVKSALSKPDHAAPDALHALLSSDGVDVVMEDTGALNQVVPYDLVVAQLRAVMVALAQASIDVDFVSTADIEGQTGNTQKQIYLYRMICSLSKSMADQPMETQLDEIKRVYLEFLSKKEAPPPLAPPPQQQQPQQVRTVAPAPPAVEAVSYTHLTLPTIYSV